MRINDAHCHFFSTELFAALARQPNVVQPTLRYKNTDDLLKRLDSDIVPTAEARREALLPPG